MNEKITEYLRSNDPELVGIGIELLDRYGLKEKKELLEESGFSSPAYVLIGIWRKDYYIPYDPNLGLSSTHYVYYKVTEESITIEEIPF